jgi:hypothetical protein
MQALVETPLMKVIKHRKGIVLQDLWACLQDFQPLAFKSIEN